MKTFFSCNLDITTNILVINFLTFALLLFILGIWGFIWNNNNILLMLLSVELMLLSVNLIFIFASILFNTILGQVFALYILAIAAAESAIGLAIFILYYKNKQIKDRLNFSKTFLLKN